MDEFTTSIAGIDFPNPDRSKSNRRMEALLTPPGERVELRPEPTNEYDEHAIAVWSIRGVQLGYVSAERAPLIGKRMKEDEVVAVFQAVHGQQAYIRIRFGGGMPTLPPPVRSPPAAPPRPMRLASRTSIDPDAFYADPEGSEWGA